MIDSWTEFAGQVALVTGGGSSIDRAVARRCAEGGGDLVVLGRRLEPLQETVRLAAELGVRTRRLTCDVRDADAVAVAVDGDVLSADGEQWLGKPVSADSSKAGPR